MYILELKVQQQSFYAEALLKRQLNGQQGLWEVSS